MLLHIFVIVQAVPRLAVHISKPFLVVVAFSGAPAVALVMIAQPALHQMPYFGLDDVVDLLSQVLVDFSLDNLIPVFAF